MPAPVHNRQFFTRLDVSVKVSHWVFDPSCAQHARCSLIENSARRINGHEQPILGCLNNADSMPGGWSDINLKRLLEVAFFHHGT
jgi:hypothetical protein